MLDVAGAIVSLVAAAMLAAQSVTRDGDWGTGFWLASAAVLAAQRAMQHALVGFKREGALLAGLALAGAGRPQELRSLCWLALPALGSGLPLLALPLLGLWVAARRELSFESMTPFARFSAVFRGRVAEISPGVASTAQRDLILARAFAGLAPAVRAPFAAGRVEPWPLHWLGEFLIFYCLSEWLPPAAVDVGFCLTYLRVATV